MRTVLITGACGQVGRRLFDRLEAAGWDTHGFDLRSGGDIRDEEAVLKAVEGCEVVVHAGAIAHDTGGTPADIVSTNVLGTWHVLLAAESAAVSRVVYFSSAQVFGFAEGEGTPEFLPVHDGHPLRASRPYGLSKRLAEEMCGAWTARTGIPTVVLRPVMILDDEGLERTRESQVELGAFVHLDDVVDATISAMTTRLTGHHRMTLCGPGAFDTSLARHLLGWSPIRTWPSHT